MRMAEALMRLLMVQDELLWAAAWLFEATDDKLYLNYVAQNAVLLGGTGWAVTEFSWDNKYAGLQVLLTKQQRVFFASLTREVLIRDDNLCIAAIHQADYILGKNPKSMSYLVGYGWNYPTHVHHRGASVPSIFELPSAVGCIDGFDDWYVNKDGNPNVIEGALVGGPDVKDEFYDDRCKYEQTEPSMVGNAPLVGLFAALDGLEGEKAVEFVHTITNTWKYQGEDYYRHQVAVKNTCGERITYLKLKIENLAGPLWGLSQTQEKKMYELPPWLKVLEPGAGFVFVYIQGGPQAAVSVVAYH
ncbi:hypothetical protein BHE74_00058722 [Ensete ventricosum]|nr:hypothetical protein BHE74_00058722 [Ensete ventricosum]